MTAITTPSDSFTDCAPRTTSRQPGNPPSAGDKRAEADADVRQGEQRPGGPGGTDGQEHGVARLVVGEAVVVGEGGDVLHAGGECEEEEFGFDEDVDADWGGEVGEELSGYGSLVVPSVFRYVYGPSTGEWEAGFYTLLRGRSKFE